MPRVNGATSADAHDALRTAVEAKAGIAFAAGCRLAVKASDPAPTATSFVLDIGNRPHHSIRHAGGYSIAWQFVVLSPGEAAEHGWTVYEQHAGGQLVGRIQE